MGFTIMIAMSIVFEIASTSPATQPISASAAQLEYESAIRQADADYKVAIAQARKTYMGRLNVAIKAAMAKSDLNEANRVDAMRKSLSPNETVPVIKAGTPASAQIAANQDWQRVKDVTNGERLVITAKGTVCVDTLRRDTRTYGPDGRDAAGVLNPNKWGMLMAKIGNNSFVVGKGTTIIAPTDGVLEMRINDPIRVDDNDGSFDVTVK